MAQIKKQETKRITIEETAEGGWVDVYISLRGKQIRDIQAKKQLNDGGVSTLVTIITDWNLENEKGVKLEINERNCAEIEALDLARIVSESGLEKYGEKLNFTKRQTTTSEQKPSSA